MGSWLRLLAFVLCCVVPFGLMVFGLGKVYRKAVTAFQARSARHDHQLPAPIVLDIEAIAVGAADEQGIPHIVLEDLVGHLPYPADREVHRILPDPADGDRRLPVLGQGDLKKLPWLYVALERHAEGVFQIRVADHLPYGG